MKWSHLEIEHKRMYLALKGLINNPRVAEILLHGEEPKLIKALRKCQDAVNYVERPVIVGVPADPKGGK